MGVDGHYNKCFLQHAAFFKAIYTKCPICLVSATFQHYLSSCKLSYKNAEFFNIHSHLLCRINQFGVFCSHPSGCATVIEKFWLSQLLHLHTTWYIFIHFPNDYCSYYCSQKNYKALLWQLHAGLLASSVGLPGSVAHLLLSGVTLGGKANLFTSQQWCDTQRSTFSDMPSLGCSKN